MKADSNRDYARLLYLQNTPQNIIAERVGVTEQTVTRWKKQDKWERIRQSMLVSKQEELARLYRQLTELNDHIEAKPEGQRYANSKEADTLGKLASAIRTLETETSLDMIVDVFIKFSDWCASNAPKEHAKLIQIQDAFIKSRLSE